MTPTEWKELCKNKMNQEGHSGLPPAIDAQTCLNILIAHLLGEDWYVADPLDTKQINTIAVLEILEKYPECRKKRFKRWLQKLVDKL